MTYLQFILFCLTLHLICGVIGSLYIMKVDNGIKRKEFLTMTLFGFAGTLAILIVIIKDYLITTKDKRTSWNAWWNKEIGTK